MPDQDLARIRTTEDGRPILDVFKDAMASLASGVAVITGLDDQRRPRGITATSITSYSANPPSVLICVANDSQSYEALTSWYHYGVNLLGADQEDVAMLFAKPDPEKFAKCAWQPGPEGIPYLEGAIARLVCQTVRAIQHGTHTIVIGEIVGGDTPGGSPLVYCGRSFFHELTRTDQGGEL